jgi:hypothetical protein
MSKLANHVDLFCSHDNTGYLMKHIDTVLYMTGSKLNNSVPGLDQNSFTSLYVVIYLYAMSFSSFQSPKSDWIRDIKSLHFDPVLTCIKHGTYIMWNV